jgi:hypothetical protein
VKIEAMERSPHSTNYRELSGHLPKKTIAARHKPITGLTQKSESK